MLRQSLSQKLLQKLSPQQIQLMKLLQIPTATLDQRIKEEMEANPALEEGEEAPIDADFEENDENAEEPEENFELDDYLSEYIEDDPSSYQFKSDNYSSEEVKSLPIPVSESFHDYLEAQLGMLELESATEIAIGHQVIGSIDQDGYLRREPIAIIDDLLFSQNIDVTEADIVDMIKKVQKFDPPGIGATDLQDCLLIQVNLKKQKEIESLGTATHSTELAFQILSFYFDEFSKKHYAKLQRYLEITEDDLKEAIDLILKFNPKPASGYSGYNESNTQYVVPDFLINNRDGELELTLNTRNAPDLRINDHYVDVLKSYNSRRKSTAGVNREDKKAVMFIKQKIDSAKWFIDAIRQRQDTLYRTMYSIMKFQEDFFRSGDETKIRPMILKDIADVTHLDISTVSRVANSKFVQTEFGTKRLKSFFSESLQTQSGEEVSTLQVKNILGGIIGAENKRKPLSDEKLKDMLTEKGYNIARRTVAKYREQLNIPVARLRKEL